MTGDQDDLGITAKIGVIEQIKSAAVGQLQIDQHRLRRHQHQLLTRFAKRGRHRSGETFAGDQLRQHCGRIRIVFDDEHMRHQSPLLRPAG